jgi:hypothetical protein
MTTIRDTFSEPEGGEIVGVWLGDIVGDVVADAVGTPGGVASWATIAE